MNRAQQIQTGEIKDIHLDPSSHDSDYYGPLDDDLDPDENLEVQDEEIYSVGELAPFSVLALERERKEKLFKIGLLIAILLHVGLFVLSQRMPNIMPSKSQLRAGEQPQQVRLVELPGPKTEEPPPEDPAAISDRNHTAERVRLPKRPTESPIGQVAPPTNRMASLQAPMAPDALEEEKTEEPPPEAPKENKPENKPDSKPEEEIQRNPQPVEEAPVNAVNRITRLEKAPDPDTEILNKKPTFEAKLDPLNKAREKGLRLRPTWNELSKGITAASRPSEYFDEGYVEEAVVDINTREERFYSYLLHLKRKIQAVWVYPEMAAKYGVAGKLTLEFLIGKNGSLEGARLLESSGHTILDEYALKAIQSAAPYHPFPARLKAKRLRIRANFVYVTGRRLGNRF